MLFNFRLISSANNLRIQFLTESSDREAPNLARLSDISFHFIIQWDGTQQKCIPVFLDIIVIDSIM